MTNAVATVDQNDPYLAYAAKTVTQEGQFLTFKTGEWLYGQDGAMLALGTRLACNMEGLKIGWRRWWNKEITDDLLELLSDQKPVPMRNSLGDPDPGMWEVGTDAKPRDPWVFTNQLQLIDAEGNLYLYSTNSKGGLNAIGQLCKAYGQERRQRPGMIPIVELQNDFYMHREYGKTYVPKFELVGWTEADTLDMDGETREQVTITAADVGDVAAVLGPKAAPGQRAANPTKGATAPSPGNGAKTPGVSAGAATSSSTTRSPSARRF
jgi:hypothetical protein